MSEHDPTPIGAWFAGAKAENGEYFAATIQRIVQDYHSWRRNYFPEDGVNVDSALRRQNESFQDAFEDRLFELLARLKADFPFQSPRYAAHMLAEQTMPAVAGYFAAMLYNPNNVSSEAAPVTVRLELEAAQMISRMLGFGPGSWEHLTSGGTVANIEALWVARSAKYLPLLTADLRAAFSLTARGDPGDGSGLSRIAIDPAIALRAFADTLDECRRASGSSDAAALIRSAISQSKWNVAERGIGSVLAALGSEPVVIVPETHHYCFGKAVDLLGIGRRALVSVAVDSRFRMIPAALEEALDRVERDGRHVLSVIAVMGTTEEGAIDPLDRIVELRDRRARAGHEHFWLHADAAYGGYLRTMVVPRRIGLGADHTDSRIAGKDVDLPLELPAHDACSALEVLGRCDSVTVDPHKLGYVPYPAGAICFRSNLVRLLARQDAPYLAERSSDSAPDALGEGVGMYILEGSKPGAAAAAVWLSHSLIPLDTTGHGLLIRDTVRNACELHSLLLEYPKHAPGATVRAIPLCPPDSNIVCYAFRAAHSRLSLAQLNALNQAIYSRFTLRAGERVYDQSFFVSRTTLAPDRYSAATCEGLLSRLDATPDEYLADGVFLLRSVLMNPWYSHAKRRGRYFLSELVSELYRVAGEELARLSAAPPGCITAPRPVGSHHGAAARAHARTS